MRLWHTKASLALAGFVSALAFLPAQAADLKFGFLFPLSGGGAAGTKAYQLGTEIAVKEVNDAGGIAGRKITIVKADDQGDPTVAVGEAQRLVFRESVDVIIGTNNSQVQLAILPVENDGKIMAIGHAGSTALTRKNAPYYFALLANTRVSGKYLVRHVFEELGAKRVAIIHDDAAATKSALEAMNEYLKEKNLSFVGEQQYKFHPTDVTSQLLSLKSAAPDLLLMYAASQDDVGIVQKGMKEIGWDVKEVGFTTASVAPQLVLNAAGPDAYKNLTAMAFKAFTYCKSQGSGDPFVASFIKKIKDADPQQTSYFTAAMGYDAIHIYKAAIEATGSTKGDVLAEWLQKNAQTLKLVSTPEPAIFEDTNFLMGEGSYAIVEKPYELSVDGFQARAGC
ncbi:ABC transporter substrate-binding protein [Aminobacter sp. MSH1]|uniref:ABC transporter substrate-binding protein n=1 Tax=Aminobacter sp. MSH1 TaxID=374606 RepID=UPI00131F432D|nr:ABC transporter substrate-binding protein [Aminobacter sp. MSH1]